MPERKNVMTVQSPAVQGEGSWVKLRKLSWAKQQEGQRLLAEAAGGTLPSDATSLALTADFLAVNKAFTVELLLESVIAWNWVDDEGNDLPLPQDDAAIRLLSADEVQFLVKALQGRADDQKN